MIRPWLTQLALAISILRNWGERATPSNISFIWDEAGKRIRDARTTGLLPNRQPHDPTNACTRWHCYSCNIDEPSEGYRVCGECLHTWPTAGTLRRAHRRILWGLSRSPYTFQTRPSIVATLWRCARVRTGDIWSCPLCAHDW